MAAARQRHLLWHKIADRANASVLMGEKTTLDAAPPYWSDRRHAFIMLDKFYHYKWGSSSWIKLDSTCLVPASDWPRRHCYTSRAVWMQITSTTETAVRCWDAPAMLLRHVWWGGGWKKCRKLILLCLFWHVLKKNNPKTTWWPPRPLVSFQKVGWARSSSEKDKTSHWSLKIISEWRFCRMSALWCSLSGKAVCTGTAARTIFISCSPKVEWPPELWQSRTNPVFPQKGFEDKLVFWEQLLSQ